MKIHHYVIIILLMACAIFLGLNLKNPPEAANTPGPSSLTEGNYISCQRKQHRFKG